MRATIVSYRRGRSTQQTNQYLLAIEGVDSVAKAHAYIGKNVVWKSSAQKKIPGKIISLHGRKGILRARFSKGLPGQALTTQVEIAD